MLMDGLARISEPEFDNWQGTYHLWSADVKHAAGVVARPFERLSKKVAVVLDDRVIHELSDLLKLLD